MKSLLKIASGVLLVVSCLLVLLLGAVMAKEGIFSENAAKLQADVAEIEKVGRMAGPDGAFAKELGKDVQRASETAQRLRIYGYGGIFVSVLALLLATFSFIQRWLPLWIVAGTGIAAVVALLVVVPERRR